MPRRAVSGKVVLRQPGSVSHRLSQNAVPRDARSDQWYRAGSSKVVTTATSSQSSSTPVATVTAERNLTFTSTVKSVETSSSGAVSTTAVAGQSLHPQVPRPVTSTTTVTQTTTTTTTKTKNKKSSQQLRPQSETITTVTTSGSKADDEEPLLSASKSDPTAGTPQ